MYSACILQHPPHQWESASGGRASPGHCPTACQAVRQGNGGVTSSSSLGFTSQFGEPSGTETTSCLSSPKRGGEWTFFPRNAPDRKADALLLPLLFLPWRRLPARRRKRKRRMGASFPCLQGVHLTEEMDLHFLLLAGRRWQTHSQVGCSGWVHWCLLLLWHPMAQVMAASTAPMPLRLLILKQKLATSTTHSLDRLLKNNFNFNESEKI